MPSFIRNTLLKVTDSKYVVILSIDGHIYSDVFTEV